MFSHKGRWKTGDSPDNHQWKDFSVRNQRFRFVENVALYDMQNDPGQTTNVIAEHPELVQQMRAAYDDWWKKTRPLMVNEDAPMSPTRPFHEWYKQQLETTGIPDWAAPQL
jgi:arylsulfatase